MPNEQFSRHCRDLRLVFDSTCLNALMTDPLSYYWSYVEGWRTSPSLEMVFGTVWHETRATYLQALMGGMSREQALEKAFYGAIDLGREHDLQALAAESANDRKKRNLRCVLRALVWFSEDWHERALFPRTLEVEWAWKIPLSDPKTGKPLVSRFGEQYFLVGTVDQVVEDTEGRVWPVECKTTTSTPGGYFFRRFDPSVQMNTYALAANVVFPRNPLGGVVIECLQSAVGFSRFEYYHVHRTPPANAAWLQSLVNWIKFAEERAVEGDWEEWMNPSGMYQTSVFRTILSKPPALWRSYLATYCTRAPLWNPEAAKPVHTKEQKDGE